MNALSKFKVDVGHFKMIIDYYDRKCPCWGGEHSCPCLPFVETKKCKCGAVRDLDDPKAHKERFETYEIDFHVMSDVVNNDHKCPGEEGVTCFCEEFLESGVCRMHAFRKLGTVR